MNKTVYIKTFGCPFIQVLQCLFLTDWRPGGEVMPDVHGVALRFVLR